MAKTTITSVCLGRLSGPLLKDLLGRSASASIFDGQRRLKKAGTSVGRENNMGTATKKNNFLGSVAASRNKQMTTCSRYVHLFSRFRGLDTALVKSLSIKSEQLRCHLVTIALLNMNGDDPSWSMDVNSIYFTLVLAQDMTCQGSTSHIHQVPNPSIESSSRAADAHCAWPAFPFRKDLKHINQSMTNKTKILGYAATI